MRATSREEPASNGRDTGQQPDTDQNKGPVPCSREARGQTGDDGQRRDIQGPLPHVDDDGGGDGDTATLLQDDGADEDLAEQERRQQQAEAGEVADVGVVNRDAGLSPPAGGRSSAARAARG